MVRCKKTGSVKQKENRKKRSGFSESLYFAKLKFSEIQVRRFADPAVSTLRRAFCSCNDSYCEYLYRFASSQ